MAVGARGEGEMPHESNRGRERLFFVGHTEMHTRMSALDWSQTPVGPIEAWPQSLKSLVRVQLASQYPMIMTWGPEFTQFYNDAYSKLIGDKHPAALGTDIRLTLAEAWETLGPMIERVMRTGIANWTPALLLVLERAGYREEAYFSVSHAPAEDDAGRIVGMFGVCSEVTQQTLGERRLRLLRDLATQGSDLSNGESLGIEATSHNLAEVVREYPLDVPFALFYRRTADNRLVLQESIGWPNDEWAKIPEGESDSVEPNAISVNELKRTVRRAAEGETLIWHNINSDLTIPGGPWGEPVQQAMVLPIAVYGQAPLGVLVAGVSPNRDLDENYALFYELLVRQVTVALGNAQAYEAERQRAEALAQLDRAKTEFFNNVSHEFRTPLTLMIGPLEALMERSESELTPQDREAVALVHRNSLRLLKLVNTLLSFSRVEAQRTEAWYQPTDLSAYTSELASVFGSATEQAGLRLVVDCAPLSEPIFVDREMWEKVVLNLLSNAFKFTFEGEIRVQVRPGEMGVELTVADTGTGIAAEALPQLFERFHRVRGAQSRSHEGSGIGLALVQDLVRLHGGEVRVASELGRGTTFTVTIPRGVAHLPADQVAVSALEAPSVVQTDIPLQMAYIYRDEVLRWLPEPQSSSAVESVKNTDQLDDEAITAFSSPRSAARILLVDDNADMRAYLSRLLSGYDVEAASDGRAALESARARRPDLVLTDVMMPHVDGFELLRALRADTELKDVPIIILSARAGEEARVEGLERGADDYLVKPFRARELLAKVEVNLRHNLLHREAANQQIMAILERITDAFYALDREWRFVYINSQCEQYLGKKREDLLGKVVWDVFPMLRNSEFHQRYHDAMQSQETVHLEAYSPVVGRWLDAHAYPSVEGLSVYFRDITERHRTDRERERLLAEAQEANHVKDEFLAIVSHELRTPLNAILGWAHLLGTGSLGADDAKRGLEAIERNAKAQAQIVEDILDVSRIVTGKMRLNTQPLNLDNVLSAVLDTVRLMANAKEIRLEFMRSESVGLIAGDAARLQQVFWNLLTNAIKFTPKGGQVEVSFVRRNDQAIVEIRDNGAGIKPEFLPHVFDRFRQADMTSTRAFGGLGLGLAIVRQLVELHHGQVSAHSKGEGQGSTFSVELPLLHPHHTASSDHPIVMADVLPAPVRLRPLNAIRILIVDDQSDTRQLLAVVLNRAGAQVREVDSAQAALDAWDEFAPQILVSDIGMPDQDGYWLIAQVRAREELHQTPRIPAIALTAYTQPKDHERALAAGFERHVGKPISPAELIKHIRELVK